MEPECKNERLNLIKLLRKFKQILQNNSKEDLKLSKEDYEQLKQSYEETEKSLIDRDLFFCYLGENFDSPCPPENNNFEEYIN